MAVMVPMLLRIVVSAVAFSSMDPLSSPPSPIVEGRGDITTTTMPLSTWATLTLGLPPEEAGGRRGHQEGGGQPP